MPTSECQSFEKQRATAFGLFRHCLCCESYRGFDPEPWKPRPPMRTTRPCGLRMDAVHKPSSSRTRDPAPIHSLVSLIVIFKEVWVRCGSSLTICRKTSRWVLAETRCLLKANCSLGECSHWGGLPEPILLRLPRSESKLVETIKKMLWKLSAGVENTGVFGRSNMGILKWQKSSILRTLTFGLTS